MRRKGEITKRQIDRDWPHQVELEDGGDRLNAMHDHCTERRWNYKTRGAFRVVDRVPRDFFRFCFTVPEQADEFHTVFGGERLTIPPKVWR